MSTEPPKALENPLALRYAEEVTAAVIRRLNSDSPDAIDTCVTEAFMEVMGDKLPWAPADLTRKIAYDKAVKEFNRMTKGKT